MASVPIVTKNAFFFNNQFHNYRYAVFSGFITGLLQLSPRQSGEKSIICDKFVKVA